MTSPTPFEDRQQALNPHRDEDQARAADVAYSQLRQRGLDLTGDEDPDHLASLLEAVERFEQAVSALGGDRMTNAPDSNQPDDPELVIPTRHADEALPGYSRRISDAALRLLERAPADVDPSTAGDAALGGLAADAQGHGGGPIG
jgi:hypothetical protein